MESKILQSTHGKISPRVVYIPERDAHADEQRSNGVDQCEISASLLVSIGGQPQPHDFHQETRPNDRDVFVLGPSHGESIKGNVAFYFLLAACSIFNETSRVCHTFDVSILFAGCLQSPTFPTLSFPAIVHVDFHLHYSWFMGGDAPPPGDDEQARRKYVSLLVVYLTSQGMDLVASFLRQRRGGSRVWKCFSKG